MAPPSPLQQKWEQIYEAPFEELPWYSPVADEELLQAIDETLPRGAKILDIGSGPGTTAADLATRGYDVLGVDVASAAVDAARERFASLGSGGPKFEVSNVLTDELPQGRFDGAVDRGTFGTIPPDERRRYIGNVADTLQDDSYLFLKVFSDEEPGDWGPHRFSQGQLRTLFGTHFVVLRLIDTTFPSTLDHDPKALFAVLRVRTSDERGDGEA